MSTVIMTTFEKIEVGNTFLYTRKQADTEELVLMEKKSNNTAKVFGRSEQAFYNELHFHLTEDDFEIQPFHPVVRLKAQARA